MALPDSTSLVDLNHIKQLHLPPMVIPQQQQQQQQQQLLQQQLQQQQQSTMTDGFMLFCADQTSPSLPVKATSLLYERWNALPSESKRPYYRQAIIVNAKLEEDYDSPLSLPPPPSPPGTTPMTPKQLVPPEAIRSAALEEREEAVLGQQQPFASYPSFLSMKYSHQQRKTTAAPDIITPSPPPDDSLSSSPTRVLFNNDLTAATTTRMTISNVLPPPILQQQRHEARYLSDQQLRQQQPQSTPNTPSTTQRRKGSITLERLKRPPNAYLLFNRDMRRKLLDLDPKMTVSEISKDIGDRWKYLPSDERQPYIDAAQALKQDHLRNHPDFIYSRRSKAELAEAKRSSKAGRKLSSPTKLQQLQQLSPSPPIQGGISSGGIKMDDNNDPLLLQPSALPPATVSKKRGRQPPALSPQQPKQQRRRDPRGRKKKQAGPKHPMSGFLFFLGAIRPQVARQFPGSTVGPISKEISARWKRMTPKEREPWLLKAESDKARYAQEMQVYMATTQQQQQHQQQQQQQQVMTMSPPLRQDGNVDDYDYDDDDDDDDQVIATVVQMVNGPSPTSASSSTSSMPFI